MTEDTIKRNTPHIVLWLLTGLVLSFLVWSIFGRLDVVASAHGEVVPSTLVKSVQHLEGGIVRNILVHEGQRVQSGEPLVELDPVRPEADVHALSERLIDLKIEVAMLEAESSGSEDMKLPWDIEENYADRADRARELLESRQNRIMNEIAEKDELIAQKGSEVAIIIQRIANNEKRLTLVNEQVTISELLVKDQLSNRMNHLNLMKEQSSIEARLSEDRLTLPHAKSAMREATAERNKTQSGYLEDVRESLAAKRSEMREMETRLRKYTDALSRTIIRSPVEGVVKTVHIATLGGVVKAGQPVVDIVPGDDRLIIEARLPTQDIGYVQKGQEVQVTLASHEANQFGHINGSVLTISPDTIETKEGIPYYKVSVATTEFAFYSGDTTYELLPGVQVTCAIKTGDRSVLAYLLSPFLSSSRTALRER